MSLADRTELAAEMKFDTRRVDPVKEDEKNLVPQYFTSTLITSCSENVKY